MNNDLISFCQKYNIPFNSLGEILNDPKVIPMIRGKAFEFSVLESLTNVLDSSTWEVKKPYLNPQLNSHDQDVLIKHLPTQKEITIECKLTAKGKYSYKNNSHIFKVKCMRSRTLGVEQVNKLSEKRGVSKEQLSIHNDQYLPSDFDLVITNLANAFYATDNNGSFIWAPTEKGTQFLRKKYGENLSDDEYRNKAFNDIFIAKSSNLAVSEENMSHVICSRKKCSDKQNCGFIPNYPDLEFSEQNLTTPSRKWVHISNIETLLNDFISNY